MTRLNLANVVISKIVHKRTFFLFVKLNDEREALGFFCLPPNLIYRKFLIRLGRMWNDSGLFSLIKNYRHLSFSVVMLTLSESSQGVEQGGKTFQQCRWRFISAYDQLFTSYILMLSMKNQTFPKMSHFDEYCSKIGQMAFMYFFIDFNDYSRFSYN